MKGRFLGCATNKYIRFVADTETPVAIVPHSIAVRNKLKILPPDEDKPSYTGVTGMKTFLSGKKRTLRFLFFNFFFDNNDEKPFI